VILKTYQKPKFLVSFGERRRLCVRFTADCLSSLSLVMRYLHSSEYVKIPQGVSVEVHSRKVRVKGPRGVLVKDLSHVNMEVSCTCSKR